jgi:GcrA cell cycle regulator
VHRLGLSNRTAPASKATAAPEKPSVTAAAEAPKAKTVEREVPVEAQPSAPVRILPIPPRKPIIKAGQPLPPQPSANEVSPEALATVKEIEKSAKRLTLMELTERTCKWPVGDPATPNFWFCGHAVQQGKPYCEAHVAVAFQPMSARRDRRVSR